MASEQKLFWTFVVVLALLAAALLLLPNVEELRAPELVAAHVAIQPEGAPAAVFGPVELAAGTPFTLHAVLEGRERSGDAVYYTEAQALERDGTAVPAERIRTWERPQTARVLWRSVEGARPVLDLAPGDTLERFEMLAFVRDAWPYAWSIPGRLEPAHDDPLAAAAQVERPFGTQRYQVRIELFDDEREQLFPTRSFESLGPGDLPARVDAFPTVTAALEGALGPATAVFGLTHVRPPRRGEAAGEEGDGGDAAGGNGEGGSAASNLLATAPPNWGADLRRELVQATRQRLVFSTLPLLREMLSAAGLELEGLPWGYVSLDGEATWGEDVHPGDLLRAGDRVVVLYADAAPGQATRPVPEPGNGALDRDDLVLDYVFTPSVRPLSDVFEEQGGQVGWLALGAPGEDR